MSNKIKDFAVEFTTKWYIEVEANNEKEAEQKARAELDDALFRREVTPSDFDANFI